MDIIKTIKNEEDCVSRLEDAGPSNSSKGSGFNFAPKEIKNEGLKTCKTIIRSEKKDVWHAVGYAKGSPDDMYRYLHCDDDDWSRTVLQESYYLSTVPLKQKRTYKFRVTDIKSIDQRKDCSEISSSKPYLPGFPCYAKGIIVNESAYGAHLSWGRFSPTYGKFLHYSVCIGLRSSEAEQAGKPSIYECVYTGPSNSCLVSFASLARAFIDTTISTETGIIFLISGRNKKGYEEFILYRWVKNQPQLKTVKREAEPLPKPKRVKKIKKQYKEEM